MLVWLCGYTTDMWYITCKLVER